MDDKRIKLLRDEKVNKAVNHMAAPAIVGLLVLAIYNVVDTMFVSWLGTQATGATQVIFPITMLASAIGLMFGIGSGTYISRLLGSGKKEKADTVASVAFFTTIGVGALFTVLSLVFMEPLLRFFGASDTIMPMAKSYGKYILLGLIFSMCNMAMNNMLRAEGSAKLSMIGMATGAVLNIILDPIFIFVFGWGIEGAAIATSLSRFVSFVILLSRYLNNHSILKINLKDFRPAKEIYYEISKIGIPTFIKQVLMSVAIGVFNTRAAHFGGDNLLAAAGIVVRVYMLPMYILFGIGQGFQPVIGYNFGAKNKKRVVDTIKYGSLLSLVVAVVCSIILFVFVKDILSIFKASEQVLYYAVTGLKIYSVSIVLLAANNTINAMYQAIGRAREAFWLSVSRQGIFFMLAIYVMPIILGEIGVMTAQLSADVLTFIMTGIMFMVYVKNKTLDRDIMGFN